jgi:DNA-directed RNA polymerase specialized sigma24 family protein
VDESAKKGLSERVASPGRTLDDSPRRWLLTQDAFDRLLEQLDSNRDRAAEEYEQIRHRLMKLFKWRGCLDFEEYADITIDRVARRVAEGAEIETASAYTLFYAVAMNVLKEHWRKTERETQMLDSLPESLQVPEDPEAIRAGEEEMAQQGARIECLRHCLGRLPADSLRLIEKYYAEGDVLNKEQRKEIALELRITVNALRVRAFRIRTEVEHCVGDCLGGARSS